MHSDADMHGILERILLDASAEPTDLPLSFLKGITNNFSDHQRIGSGGFAAVYKGLLQNNKTIAIKKLRSDVDIAEKSFIGEVNTLISVKHVNIVRFLGFCSDTQVKVWNLNGRNVLADVRERLLCFEFLPKGSLDRHITDASEGLEWTMRYKIIKGICEGLHYLHKNKILHADLKPANILLDDNMIPKIADFGLSRCFGDETRIITSNMPGSLGYMAPEGISSEIKLRLSYDIYSLGVIIIEILTGKRGDAAIENVLESWSTRLQTWHGDSRLKHIRACVEMGIQCRDSNPANRPAIRRIVETLEDMERTYDFTETNLCDSWEIQASSSSVSQLADEVESIVVSAAPSLLQSVVMEPGERNTEVDSCVPQSVEEAESSLVYAVPSPVSEQPRPRAVQAVQPPRALGRWRAPEVMIHRALRSTVHQAGDSEEEWRWEGAMAQILLHGTLHATMFEAVSLSSPHRASGGAPKFIRKFVGRIKDTVGMGKGNSRLYATIDLEKARVGCTRMLSNEPVNPRWYESFHIYCAHLAADVIFNVKVDQSIGASLIGRAYLPVQELLSGEEIDRWLEICDKNREPIGDSKIHVKLQYFDVTKDRNWARGVHSTDYPGVPYSFFSQRQGCKVTLYQDAHVPDNFMPRIPLADGKDYEPHRCWEDIFDAISNAQHLIYITGWSVYTEITLVRDTNRPKPGGDITIGELLKRKASEGVRVLMLVWEDRTSVGLLKKDGLMATHDWETANFFHGSEVHCVLCPRNPDDSGSIVQDLQISTMFTHHQKIVVVDHEMPNQGSELRRIVSFVGGIDLCDGRYDTQYHSLFRTLDTVHHDDFYQPNFTTASIKKGGPRKPWHDIHSRLEGPIAWDVLYNFEQRWRKQSGKDLLVRLRELSDIITPPSPVMFPEDKETWNVQLFRSIDGGAAFGFPETPEDAARAGLVSGKDQIIDRSIQDAYIHAIRRAKNFIYIENQYFLGSSYCWKPEGIKPEEIGALQLIPKELSLKIMSKIEAGERFTVYVVVPMWPKGVPESAFVQAILDWQRRTMDMMYTDIIQALQAKGIEANPRDYLTFFCLGNREVKQEGEYEPEEQPKPDTDYIWAQEARRFMIYVHSKMMIVDDEYIIIGSANINQRSMDGARDSEIAMGAYQPYHLSTRQPARGQIHGFRMALWYEHLGMLDDAFQSPNSLECVRKVNKIAEKYWDMYASDVLEQDLPGHLLSYPIGITEDGTVTELPGMEFFPDTRARVLGRKSDYLPTILTT